MEESRIVMQDSWAGQAGTLRLARDVPGTIDLCSGRLGWRSLLIRRYDAQPHLDDYEVPAIADQRIILFQRAGDNAGRTNVEVREGRRWNAIRYRHGDLSMLGPHRERWLRWHTRTVHRMVHLYLPGDTIEGARQAGRDRISADRLTRISHADAVIVSLVEGLLTAVEQGHDERYAEAAAIFLSLHLWRSAGMNPVAAERNVWALTRVNGMLADGLGQALSNADLAREIGRSTFQLIRMCQAAWGETPMQRLTRLRIDRARTMLQRADDSVLEIALQCGYDNPSHFATAFRRHTGLTPSQYRAARGACRPRTSA